MLLVTENNPRRMWSAPPKCVIFQGTRTVVRHLGGWIGLPSRVQRYHLQRTQQPLGWWSPSQPPISMEKVGEGFSRHLLLDRAIRNKGKEENDINLCYFYILHQCLENIGHDMLRVVPTFQDRHTPFFLWEMEKGRNGAYFYSLSGHRFPVSFSAIFLTTWQDTI